MDKLLEDSRQFAQVLQSSSSTVAANWKTEDLERAFHWAGYFKQVQSRVGQNHSVVQRLDAQMKQMGRVQLCRRFGGEELSCDFLGHSSVYLVKALLENPVLPAELREKILAEHIPPGSPLVTHCERLASSAQLLQTLSLIHAKLSQSGGCATHLSTDTQTELLTVDAYCLQDDINWQLQSVSDSSNQRHTGIHMRLLELSKREKGLQVILLALTQAKPATYQSHQTGFLTSLSTVDLAKVQAAILKWLLREFTVSPPTLDLSEQTPTASCKEPLNTADRLWEQPPRILAAVSDCHFDFFKAYLQYLVGKTEMIGATGHTLPSPSNVGPGAAPKVEEWEQELEAVVSHWQALIAVGGRVKDVCTSLVESRLPFEKDKALPPGQDVWSKLYFRTIVHSHRSI